VPNSIAIDQNKPDNLELLRASRQALSDAKGIGTWQTGLAVSAVIVGFLVSLLLPELRSWAALYSVLVLIVDVVFLESAVKEKQESKAKL